MKIFDVTKLIQTVSYNDMPIFIFTSNVDAFNCLGWRSRSRGRRPWDRNRSAERIWGRRPTGERYRQLEEMEQDGVPRRRQQYGRNYQDEGECH